MDQRDYEVFLNQAATPPMYGVCGKGVSIGHISTDYQEVSRLVRRCNRGKLSAIHLEEVVEDFRRSE